MVGRKIFMLLLAIFLVTTLVFGQTSDVLDKDVYSIEEKIVFHFDSELVSQGDVSIQIISNNGIMKYSGKLNSELIFTPKVSGNHKLIVSKSGVNLIEKTFIVNPKNNPGSSSISEINTSKLEYSFGEDVEIFVDNSSEIKLEVKGDKDFFSYIGKISQKLLFKPSEEGTYEITLKDVYNNLVKKFKFEVKSNKEIISKNNTKLLELTSYEVKNLKENIDKKYNKLDFTKKTLKLKNSKNQKKFLESRLIKNNQTGEDELIIKDISPKLINGVFRGIKTDNLDFGYETLSSEKNNQIFSIIKKELVDSYAIDPTSMSFNNASLIMRAAGTELYKCKEWNFTLQTCFGSWVKIKDLIPGTDYELVIDSLDPGYAETGVTSINTNKSIYHPNESVKILLAILDKDGFLVNPSELSLNIVSPAGKLYSFNKSNLQNSAKGIYELNLNISNEIGNYIISSNAIGYNLNITMLTSFEVRDFYEFDIIRKAPITTDPWQGPINSTIIVNSYITPDNNKITLEETVPTNFAVVDLGGASISLVEGEKKLTWYDLPLSTSVTYSVQPPLVTPDLYSLGPAVIRYTINASSKMFIEARPWYIAIDPVSDLTATSCAGMENANNDNQYGVACTSSNIDSDNSINQQYIAGRNKWGGIQVIADNALSNCLIVNKVEVCTNWWVSQTPNTCIGTDVSITGVTGSFTNIDSTCPTSDGGLSCTDVTSTFTWVCNSWQSSNAVIRVHEKNANSVGALYFDAVFFRVNYTQASALPTPISWNKNESTVFQNMFVNFSSTWTDDQGLSGWIFSINLGAGWTNSSFASFDVGGISSYIQNITASQGVTVYWKFYANDSQGQWNVTPEQSFIVSASSDTEAPVINSISVTPSIGSSGTVFNISANVTDNIGVDSVYADILLPNGTRKNYTLAGIGGNIWQYLYTSNIGGEFSFIIWGVDGNGNYNKSSTTDYFNVSSIMSTNKLYYSRGETIAIIGNGFSSSNNVTVDIKKKSDGVSVSGYPKLVSTNINGVSSENWDIPSLLTFPPGNYTITINDTINPNLTATQDVIIIIRPTAADLVITGYPARENAFSINDINDTDSNFIAIGLPERNEDYLEVNFTNNVPIGYDINEVIFGFEHWEDYTATVYLKVFNSTSSAYETACTYTPNSVNRFDYCNLSNYFLTATDANLVSIRISDNDLVSKIGDPILSYVNFTFLDIQYSLSATTTVIINNPTYTISAYDFTETTNNNAYGGSKLNTYLTLLTGTQATTTEYTNLEASNDNRYVQTLTSGANNERAYHSFKFTVIESITQISSLKFYYEGHALRTTSNTADQYSLFVWNFITSQYDSLLTSASSTTDIESIVTLSSISDYVDSSTGEVYFLAESSGVQSQGGGENQRVLNTDYAKLEVLQYPTLSGTQNINVTAIDSDGIASCNYSFRSTSLLGSLFFSSGNNYNGSADTTTIPDGFYWLDAVCLDTSSNSGNDSIYLQVLNTPPLVNLISPINYENLSNSTKTFQFNATSGVGGIISCNMTLDGVVNNPSSILTTSGAITNYTINSLSEGTHYWNVTCWNNPSSTNTSQTREFNVDTTPPTIIKNYPLLNDFINSSSFDFLFTPSDINALSNCSLYVDGALNQTKISAQLTNGVQNNFSINSLAEGLHNWGVMCYDSFNNSLNTTSTNFYVDLTKPTTVLNYPNPGDIFGFNNINFNWTSTDNLDTSLLCNITINGVIRSANVPVTSGIMASDNIILVNGLHYWNVTCFDSAGNINISETRNLSVQGPPLPILLTPSNYTGGFNSTTGFFTYNATDDTGVDNCSLYIDGVFNQTKSSIITNGINNFTVNNIVPGNHTWQVFCENGAGAGNSEEWTFWVDLVSPSVTLSQPYNGTEINGSTITLNWTAIDDWTNNLSCNLNINAATYSGINSPNNTLVNYTLNGLTDGYYNWNITCYDRLGKSNTSETRWFKINGAPTIALNSPVNNYNSSLSIIDFFYTPTDSGGLANCSIFLDGVLNQTNSSPVLSGVQSNFTINGIAQGIHNWAIGCYDTVGDYTNTSVWNFTVDLTDPTVIPQSPNGTTLYSGDVYFNFTASDNFDDALTCSINITNHGIIGPIYPTNATLFSYLVTGINDGFHNYTISCIDNSGRVGESTTLNFTIDTEPVITMISPINYFGDDDGNVIFNYTATDTSGVANCSFFLNGTFQEINTSIDTLGYNYFLKNGLAEGLYNWSVMCYDGNGFQANSSLEWFYVDKTPPSNITLNYPYNQSKVYASNIQFNLTVTDSVTEFLECDYYIDGAYNTTIYDAKNATPYLYNIPGFTQGIHNWSVACYDSSYLSITSQTYTFNVSFDPLVTLINPQNLSWQNSSSVDIFYIPQDNNATLQYCDLYVDGAINQGLGSVASGVQHSATIVGLNESMHSWYITCGDWDGNPANSSTWNFTVDLTPPQTTLTTPTPAQAFNVSTVTFNFTSYDNMATTLSCSINLDGVLIDGPRNINNNSYYNYTKTGIDDGIHFWNSTCVDLAGNSNTSETRNFTVNEPPTVTLGLPSTGTRVNSVNNTFFFTPYDNSNNITSCTIVLNGVLNNTNNFITASVENNITVNNMVDGEYNWTINCTDGAGNNGTNLTTNQFIVDLTPPSINMITPAPFQIMGYEDVNFNWSSTDFWATNLYCNLTIDGAMNASNLSLISGIAYNYTVFNMPFGPHNWSLTCSDDLGNTNSTLTQNFTVQAPELVTNNSMIWFNKTNPNLGENVNIILNISNTGSSTATNFIVQFFDGNPATGTQIGNNQTLTLSPGFSILANQSWIVTSGYHNIFALVNPNFAIFELDYTNNNATINMSVLSATLDNSINNTWTNDLTPEINFTLQDYTLGLINYTILIDGISNGQSGQVTDNVSFALNLSTLTEGIHYIEVRATDNLGRIKISNRLYLNIDNTAPTANFVTPNNTWYNITTPNIFFNITDSLDLNINYTIYVDSINVNTSLIANDTNTNYVVSPLLEGKHNITIETLDEANNTANYTISIYIDLTKPTLSLNFPLDNANFTSTSVLLNISASDNLATNLNCTISLDGVNITNQIVANGNHMTYLATGLSESTHYWNATCTDLAGNTNFTQTKSFNIFIPPVITLLNPQNNYWSGTASNTFYFNVTDDTGVENCSVLINGVINSTKLGSDITLGALNNISATLSEGIFDWGILCYDNTSQNVMNYTNNRTITVDLTAPNVAITTLNNTWTNLRDISIFFNLTDNLANNISYNIYETGALNASGNFVNPSFGVSNIITLAGGNGPKTIIVEAIDYVGNKKNSTPITVWFDDRTPTITLNAPNDGNITLNDTVLFNFTVRDTLSPNVFCNLTIDGIVNKTYNLTSAGVNNITEETIFGFAAGIHYWNVTCIDLAGNYKASLTRNFTIPAPDLLINSGNITFSKNNPRENENITLYANIYSIGGTKADNIIVQFYKGDPNLGGTQIGLNQTISTLAANTNKTVSVNWTTLMGTTSIYVLVDPPISSNGSIAEDDETNNKAFNSISISGYHIIAGNSSSTIDMNNNLSRTIFSWGKTNKTGDNLFVADYESAISWTSLQAIGKDKSGVSEFDDFAQIDTALSMDNFSDSINSSYTSGGAPISTKTFTVFSNSIVNVPIINSTNTSNFVTGILWDTDDGDNYNGTQDLLFITEINQAKLGFNGTYDFEIKVPAALREYKTINQKTVAFYAELK